MSDERLSNKSIRKAGANLKDNIATSDDLDIISTFRSNHIPLMKMLVKTLSKKLPKPIFIARRLKRLNSIKAKLTRFSGMNLDRMQDIGGVRAVFKNDNEVMNFARKVKETYSEKGALEIVKENDYIKEPKDDGYRSYHIIFKYNGKIPSVSGYHIELQLRSILQHYWATAVEILALKSETNIKAGYGQEHYKRFFWLCAELFTGKKEFIEEIKELDDKHNILILLSGLNVVANKLQDKGQEGLYLLILDTQSSVLKLLEFGKNEIETAKEMYQNLETSKKTQSVLVSVDSIKKLKKAYPNYFMDAKSFIKEVKQRAKYE
ncbi:RelA/SpoT domain-containing protein [Campylobacter pinnipediorum subsp. caledonicus]|uniref:RelA/SpoT domain-containing protein n=1 Tax=Campylobacter pinnipediorum subsp. caledonicus TaxID=1874362 RepID=A0A1S6U5Y2_9BACT|nr:RelA/SpoT domain-containing protein [Campylobacter pinnipediorum]AQW87188.1 RelA/SpoT domain-containing protein [Campylobacter pinnipediorum subsp. caledonicus]OPA71862.1 hypothetical protein BB381_06925 [Campylobacter pinnipediorum subsp. caledonicus]